MIFIDNAHNCMRVRESRNGWPSHAEEVRQHRARAYEFIHEVLPRTFSPL